MKNITVHDYELSLIFVLNENYRNDKCVGSGHTADCEVILFLPNNTKPFFSCEHILTKYLSANKIKCLKDLSHRDKLIEPLSLILEPFGSFRVRIR